MMVSLVDIGPLRDTVTIRGQDLEVRGLPTLVIFNVLQDNVAVKKLVMGKGFKPEDLMELINTSPAILAEFIAAGTGSVGDPAAIEAAINLTAGEQAMIIEKVLAISFPQGLSQFIQSLQGLVSGAQPEKSGKVAVTN